MGEFKILLIATDIPALGQALTAAAKQFSGYTLGKVCEGAWFNGVEIVRDSVQPLYLAARDAGEVTEFARWYRILAKQDCVYVRYPNGGVELVK